MQSRRKLKLARRHREPEMFPRISTRRDLHYPSHFLQAFKRSGGATSEWAIGAYIKDLTIDGDPWTRAITALSLLRALLSGLPQLSSLRLMGLIFLDDLSQETNALQSRGPRFKLDTLFVDICKARDLYLKHLLALVRMFSSIRELTMTNWEADMRNPLSVSSLVALTFPAIQSLIIVSITDFHVMRVIYALLTESPSVKDGHLTRIDLYVWSGEELSVFSDFAKIAGPALQEVEPRVVGTDFIGNLNVFHALSFPTCTALRSLALCIECYVIDSPLMARLNADISWLLYAYTEILQAHRDVSPALTVIRLEMSPGGHGLATAEALIHIALRDDRGQVGATAQDVTEDAWEDESMWTLLEDVLRGFPALTGLELVILGNSLMEKTKAELRGALERRLPRLCDLYSRAFPVETPQLPVRSCMAMRTYRSHIVEIFEY